MNESTRLLIFFNLWFICLPICVSGSSPAAGVFSPAWLHIVLCGRWGCWCHYIMAAQISGHIPGNQILGFTRVTIRVLSCCLDLIPVAEWYKMPRSWHPQNCMGLISMCIVCACACFCCKSVLFCSLLTVWGHGLDPSRVLALAKQYLVLLRLVFV